VTTIDAQVPPEAVHDLRIDPLLLASVKEYRHVLETIGSDIYPGWRWNTIPLLLYRPKVQDILLNAPHRPPGFADFTGHTVLPDRTIYARNDSTTRDIDGQNTSITLDSMRVLVVADEYSRMREQIRGTLRQHSDSLTQDWLEKWRFIQSPYDELGLILHEAFHVQQDRLAPGKGANEAAVAHYPVLDRTNNALVALEARLLRDAVLAPTPAERRAKTEQFLAIRSARRTTLDTASISYENLNEFKEGTAKYVQYRFLQIGERVTPTPEMYFHTGFIGYRAGLLRRLLEDEMDDMVAVAAFSDNRFGNKFGGGPLRFRLYASGGAQGLLLDEFAPDWKSRIFAPGVYLTDLLAEALPLSDDRRARLAAQAKAGYGYDSILVNREALEVEGRRAIQQRVDEILNTSRTLVTVSYAAAGDITGLRYTPFGMTAVDDHTTMYDLVPFAVRFANKTVLTLKSVLPVIVDRQARTVTFAVSTAASAFEGNAASALDLPELTLVAPAATTIRVSGNRVIIVFGGPEAKRNYER
jgi:hypothetical protein